MLSYTRSNLFSLWFISNYVSNKVFLFVCFSLWPAHHSMYFCWCVLVIKSTEQNPEGRMLSNVFGKKENNPPKERQHSSFRNSCCAKKKKKRMYRKGQFCDWKGMWKSESLPTQKERSRERLVSSYQAGCWLTKNSEHALPGRRAVCLPLWSSEDWPASSWHRDLDFVKPFPRDSWEAFWVRHRPRLTPASSHWASICQTLRCLEIIRKVYFKCSILGPAHQRFTTFRLVPRNWH